MDPIEWQLFAWEIHAEFDGDELAAHGFRLARQLHRRKMEEAYRLRPSWIQRFVVWLKGRYLQ